MDFERLCPGCMSELTEVEKQSGCPYCGYRFDTAEEGQAHRLKPYTVLNDKYVIGRVLGEGGFGITYLGYDLTLEMKIAIKEYYPSGYVTREVQNGNTVTAFTGQKGDFYRAGKKKFIHEARTLAKFSSLPGIVSVRDYFEANNTSYIIMEYLDGETLNSYLKNVGGRIPLPRVLEMMRPVIQSLSEVHRMGLIHRDISPDNIMILKNGNMKLLDFGAAREVAGAEADKSLSVMLKPGYAPEEQYRAHGNQGPWTDLYAICGTIYKCLTGKAPVEAMERMRNDTLVWPSRMGVAIPGWQEAALMKGMALYAENRFRSLGEFYQAFYLNQYSGENNRNDSRPGALAGANMANQAGFAWGGKMNPQDNQFGGQNNAFTGNNTNPGTGAGNNMNGQPGGMQFDPNTGMQYGQNGQFGANNTQNGQYGAAQNDPFTMNGQQNNSFAQNGAQNNPYTMNGAQNNPYTMNGQQNNSFAQNGPQNNPYAMNGNNFSGPQYAYGGAQPGQNDQKNNKTKLGVIVGVIVVIVIAIIAILVGMLLNGNKKDNDKDVATGVTPTIEAGTPTPEEVTETPAPEEETPTPEEVTETPTPEEATPTPETTYVPQSEGVDYRAAFTGYTDEAITYMLLKNNQWSGNNLVYTDTERYFVLTDMSVRYFTVIGSDVYYSTYNSSTETYAFWKQALSEGSQPEQLLNGTQVCAFSYYDGLIYYDNYDDYYELYCYNPSTGENWKVDSHSLNYYYILDGYIYYECLDDGAMYKMSLDGTDKQFLFYLSDYNISHLSCLTVFEVDRAVFLAFTSTDGYMYITTEDGSAYEEIASGLQDFDLNQDIYYADGSLYYSTDNGTRIHKLDIAEYLRTDIDTIPDSVISKESFIFFEVNNGLIYIELYGGNNEIMVIDYQTGETYNTFDFS